MHILFNLCLFYFIMSFDFNMFELTYHAYFTELILLYIVLYIYMFILMTHKSA